MKLLYSLRTLYHRITAAQVTIQRDECAVYLYSVVTTKPLQIKYVTNCTPGYLWGAAGVSLCTILSPERMVLKPYLHTRFCSYSGVGKYSNFGDTSPYILVKNGPLRLLTYWRVRQLACPKRRLSIYQSTSDHIPTDLNLLYLQSKY